MFVTGLEPLHLYPCCTTQVGVMVVKKKTPKVEALVLDEQNLQTLIGNLVKGNLVTRTSHLLRKNSKKNC